MKKTTIVILVSLTLAFVLLIAGSVMDGFGELRSMYRNGEMNIPLVNIKTTDMVEEFSNIDSMEIDGDAAKVNIIEYEGATIKVDAKSVSTKVQIYQNNQTLVIKDTYRWENLPIGNNHATVDIYIPNSYQFKKVNFDVDAGEYTVGNLKAEQIIVDVDAGDFNADNIICSYAKMDVDAGDIKIGLLNSYDSKFDCDVGDIDVTMVGSESDYRYDVECDIGDLTIGSYSCDGLSEEHHKSDGNRKIEAECNIGSIKINMEV